jgi:hypothetical protein
MNGRSGIGIVVRHFPFFIFIRQTTQQYLLAGEIPIPVSRINNRAMAFITNIPPR